MIIHLISTLPESKWPKEWKHCYNRWKSGPYQIKLWGKEDIIKELIADDKEFYNNYLSKLDKIYQIDYVRYIILNKYGGAYFDMDVELIVDFIPLLNKKTTYILEGSIGELVSNAIIITYKEANMWEHIIERAKHNIIQYFSIAQQDNYNTVKLVGPLFLSKWIANFWNIQRIQKISSPNIELLGWGQFQNPYSTFAFTKHYSTHIWGGQQNNNAI